MCARHHYVSQFHLRQFTDPNSVSQRDPWVWQGWIADGRVERCAPKNMGWKQDMFDGPGALADRNTTLESFLANEVESPAAAAMKEMCLRPVGSGGELPPALFRYVAWAAARSLPMQTLEAQWAANYKDLRHAPRAEEPPDSLLNATELHRDIQMTHPTFGAKVFSADSDFDRLADEGWFPDPTERQNFLQMVHIQSHYFQVRFFPRLKWFTLHAPKGEFFIIGDRAVGWAVDGGYVDAPPSCLRDPSAYVLGRV